MARSLAGGQVFASILSGNGSGLGSSGLQCAMGGGVTGELGVSFAVSEALDEVCVVQLCPSVCQGAGYITTELWGALRPPSAMPSPGGFVTPVTLRRFKDRLLCVFDPD